jgi:hypothetical protein
MPSDGTLPLGAAQTASDIGPEEPPPRWEVEHFCYGSWLSSGGKGDQRGTSN